jgi:hypothetical protein
VRVGVSAAELLRVGRLPAVAAATVWASGRYGFSPTEDEFVPTAGALLVLALRAAGRDAGVGLPESLAWRWGRRR